MTAQRTETTTPSDPVPRRGAPPVNWPVFISSFVVIVGITLWAWLNDDAEADIKVVVDKVTLNMGWFYVALATVIVGFILYLALSRYGRLRLGPDHSRPEFSTFSWTAMLFAAGIGTDVMFFSVIEPVTQYTAPPTGQAETVEAAREATVWTMFHYGVTGWSMYALMGMALGYFSYRMGLPLAVRSALRPIFGRRVEGALGHAVDSAAVLGTIFGVATSLGIGVVFLNVGLNVIWGVPIETATQSILALLAVAMAAVSATTGVDKGIRLLSQLNVILALILAAWILVTGKSAFFLEAIVLNVGDFARTFPAKTIETFAFTGNEEWMSLWTLFFWAWWVAWASFVGMFLARISRGRTIRQFVLGCLILPFSYIVVWVSIFGNAAIDKVRGGDAKFAEAAADYSGAGFYDLLQDYPLASLLVFIAFLVGLLFYVTSADSGALVMGNLCSRLRDVQEDCAAWQRILWATVTGLLTVAMLAAGGIVTLQYATIIMGLPFAFVLILVMWGLLKALRVEGRRADSHEGGLAALLSARSPQAADGRQTWKARLSRAVNFVDVEAATDYQQQVIAPALSAVADELNNAGVATVVRQGVDPAEGDLPFVELHTEAPEHRFVYRVQVQMSPVPTYGGRMIGDRDQYARLEVYLSEGGQDYDVMGYTELQVIHDCLDRYEHHLEFLRTS